MKFIFIFGPQAVGKMTVGQELEKKTGFKLFHNHMTIDLLVPFFGFSPKMWKLANHFRMEIFKEAAESNLDGIIFTYVWAFNEKEDWDFVDSVCGIFESRGADIYFVELEAGLDERLRRNRTPNRLANKPTKRDVAGSEAELKESMDQYRMNSLPGEITRKHYIKINNAHLSAEETAETIVKKFTLKET